MVNFPAILRQKSLIVFILIYFVLKFVLLAKLMSF